MICYTTVLYWVGGGCGEESLQKKKRVAGDQFSVKYKSEMY